MFDHRDGVSTRQAARKFKCSQPYIVKTLSTKTSIKIRKKQKIPSRNDDQRERIPKCCDRLYRKLQGNSVILDDESYFTLTHSTINGNQNFYSSEVAATSSKVKYRQKMPVCLYPSQLKAWIQACFKKINLNLVKRTLASTRLKVGQVKRNGVIEDN